MIAAVPAGRRSLNTWLFAPLCFAAAFLWELAFAILWDRAGLDAVPWIPAELGLFFLFVAPIVLCGVLAWRLGQFRSERPPGPVLAAAACCLLAPFVVIVPFFNFMCLVFNSCFGD